MSAPLLLADCPAPGSLRLNQEAVLLLMALPQPIKVVSVFGPRQTGKSYLLNQLAGSKGFKVATGDTNKSPGVFMWLLPAHHDTGANLVLLDSEGFEEDVMVERQVCSPIFTLSVLLSSVFLYNTCGPVSRETLDKLLHVTFFPSLVKLPADEVHKNFLPDFVWCVRDENLVTNIGNIEVLAEDFLDSVLNDVKDPQSPSSCIINLFERSKMKLFDFCRPHVETEDLMNLRENDVNPAFIRQTHVLQKFLLRSSPKVLTSGSKASGKDLGDLLQKLVDAMLAGTIMDISLDTTFYGEGELAVEMDVCPKHEEIQQLPVVEAETLQGSQQWGMCAPSGLSQDFPFINSKNKDMASVDVNTVRMTEPICLIENTAENELKVSQPAVDILNNITQPVVVVSIVGLYRTGKSYLMNRLAGTNTGFSLGSTIQSETKGIWMWCVPHPRKVNSTLILLDTEGLGDVEKGDQKNDNWIFVLTVLFSSTLIYNSIGCINNEALMQLHYVTELTKHIKLKSISEDEEQMSSEYVHFFPSFVWAVRDFTLQLICNGKPITSEEYLENALKLKNGYSSKLIESNSARECIRNYFPTRTCFVFDQPTSKEKLKIIEELSDDCLDCNFIHQMAEFCNHIYNCSQEKALKGGIKVTGRILASMALTYVSAIQSGQVPCLEGAVTVLAKQENRKAAEEACTLYRQLLTKRVQIPTQTQAELSDVHNHCLKEALQYFMDHSFKDEDQHFQKQLMELIRNEYEKMHLENDHVSHNFCTALLLQLEESMDSHESYLRPGGYVDFKDDLGKVLELYRDAPGKGVKAKFALEEFLNRMNDLSKTILIADKNLTQQQRCLEEQQARAEAERRRAATMKEEQLALERKMQDQEKAYKQNERYLMEKMQRDLQIAQEEHQKILDQKLKEQTAYLSEGFNQTASRMQCEIDQLQQQIKNSQQRQDGRGRRCIIS